VDGVTHPLPRPFIVLATQNPIEYEGTFPLPEAQLDRFLLRVRLGYPGLVEEEIDILERQQFRHPIEDLEQVATVKELTEAQEAVKAVYVAPPVKRYMVELTRETRQHQEAYLGASPRGSLTLYRAGRARASILGRDYVLPDDVKTLALPALAHRVIPGPAARLRDVNAERIVQEVVDAMPVPGGDVTSRE
jgi:MoxR-like ATPase